MSVDEPVARPVAVVESPAGLLARILDREQVSCVFQPIVDLDTGAVVAYEALARGPIGALERPDDLFGEARRQGRLADLDQLCCRVAVRSAIDAGIYAPLTLFINVEPETIDVSSLEELAEMAPGELHLVLEITERSLASRPAELLATVQRLRRAGWRIALDDVGADDLSLTFMPVLRPEIVKLDLSLVQNRPSPEIADIMNAVNAYAERTGAVILAEGIEDAAHLAVARSLGARLGQGWLFGRPAVGIDPSLAVGALTLPPVQTLTAATPFECVPGSMRSRESLKPLLVEVSKHLERQAARQGRTCLVLSTFQHATNFTPHTGRRYRELATQVGFVAAIAAGLGDRPVPGVRGAGLAPTDPVSQEWDVVVIGPHFAAALLARDLGGPGPDLERRFEFVLTYDRPTVEAAAESLMSRVSAHSQLVPVEEFTTAPPQGARQPLTAVSRTDQQPGVGQTPTELPGVRQLRLSLAAVLQHARVADRGIAVIHLGLADLQGSESTLGYGAVATMLLVSASRLRRRLRRGDLVSQVGPDGFVVVLTALDQSDADSDGRHVADQLLTELSKPFSNAPSQVTLTFAAGVSTYPADSDSVDGLLGLARSRSQLGSRVTATQSLPGG